LAPQFDDVQKMATFASRSTKVFGFTTEVMFVVMANIESRQQLTSCCPAASLMLAEVALGTDDLEGEFGMLVRGCGAKPSIEAAFGFQEKCDYLFYTLRNQHACTSMALPSPSPPSATTPTTTPFKDRGWNDGKFLADKMAYEVFVKHWLERARNELSMRRGGSIRSLHKMK